MWAQLCQLEIGPQGEQCYFIACDSSANHCPQFSYLSLNDAIWTFSKAIVFHRGKKLSYNMFVTLGFMNFRFFMFFSCSGILLLKVGIKFFEKLLIFESANADSAPKKNPTTPNCSWYCFVSSSCSLKVSLLLCLQGRKCNYCKHCLKSEFLVWWFHWSACRGRMRQAVPEDLLLNIP